jgi:hypothetical protein
MERRRVFTDGRWSRHERPKIRRDDSRPPASRRRGWRKPSRRGSWNHEVNSRTEGRGWAQRCARREARRRPRRHTPTRMLVATRRTRRVLRRATSTVPTTTTPLPAVRSTRCRDLPSSVMRGTWPPEARHGRRRTRAKRRMPSTPVRRHTRRMRDDLNTRPTPGLRHTRGMPDRPPICRTPDHRHIPLTPGRQRPMPGHPGIRGIIDRTRAAFRTFNDRGRDRLTTAK